MIGHVLSIFSDEDMVSLRAINDRHLLGGSDGMKNGIFADQHQRTPLLVPFMTEDGIFSNQDCLVSSVTKMVSLATNNDWTPFIL